MPRKPDLSIIGQTYNSLTVLSYTDQRNSYGRGLYLCRCLLCGGERLATRANLLRGEIKDCGCSRHLPGAGISLASGLGGCWSMVPQSIGGKCTIPVDATAEMIPLCPLPISSGGSPIPAAVSTGAKMPPSKSCILQTQPPVSSIRKSSAAPTPPGSPVCFMIQ